MWNLYADWRVLMKYEKAQAEILNFDSIGFLAMNSSPDYSTPEGALEVACGQYSGTVNNFSCGVFGGYDPTNPPTQNDVATVTLGEYTYYFDYKGNHWKLHK